MVIQEKEFNKQIDSFFDSDNENQWFKLIKKMYSYYPNCKSHYELFDKVGAKVGISFISQEVIDDKTERPVGYVPLLIFSKDNLLNEDERVCELGSYKHPVTLAESYGIIAKDLLYRFFSLYKIDEILKNTND